MIYYKWLESPLGDLLLTSDGRSVRRLYLDRKPWVTRT